MIILLLLFFLSCSPSIDVAGTSTETTNGYAGIVMSSELLPVEGAEVTFFNRSTIISEQVVYTDSLGYFEVTFNGNSRYNISVANTDSSELSWNSAPHTISEDSKILNIQLNQPGTLVLQRSGDDTLWLAETPFIPSIVTDSTVVFENIPVSTYPVVLDIFDNRPIASANVVAGDTLSVPVVITSNKVLIDDFNDGDSLVTFSLWQDDPWGWGTSVGEPFSEILILDEIETNYLFFASTFGSPLLSLIEISFGENKNLSTLDSVSFRAKGTKDVELFFGDIGLPPEEDYRYASYTVVVTDEWQTYTVSLSDYPGVEFGGISSWDELAGSIDNMQISQTFDGDEFSVDDIYFHGIASDSLY